MDIQHLQQQALAAVQAATTLEALEAARVAVLGKSGTLTEVLKQLGGLDPAARAQVAAQANAAKEAVQTALTQAKTQLEEAALAHKLQAEALDLTLPATWSPVGKVHPLSAVMAELAEIMTGIGFGIQLGPQVTTDYYNFTALNIPATHPARQDHDTFYLPDGPQGQKRLLRTQTSNAQILAMETTKPPFRMVAPGRVYRCDSDATHTPQFHQMEGMAIDKDLTFAHLKGVLQYMLSTFFGKEVRLRLRPSYFPFTEPSVEIDVGAEVLGEEVGQRISKGTGWLEVLGAGMIHPNVLKHGGIDPTQWQGFAFGCGLERLAMLKYGIHDLRLFYESHQHFLQHFGKSPAAV